MTGWMKALLIGGASAAGAAAVAAAVYFGMHYFQKPAVPAPKGAVITSSSPDFTKAAYEVDANGNLVLDSSGNPVPVTGPVHPGDVIEYVLSYNPAVDGPTMITDTLSPNQTYVNASLQAAGWTYTPAAPYSVGNTETYSNPGTSGSSGLVLTVPAISGSTGTTTGGGDGFEPVPVLTAAGVKVFGVNHHLPYSGTNPQIMCWFGASLAPCAPGYPRQTSAAPIHLATSDFPHAVIYQKKVYFPVGRYSDATYTTLEFGVACWDAETDAACPFIALPGAPSVNMSGSGANYLGTRIDDYLAGLRADPLNPSHAYVYANGTIYCVDLAAAGAACAGWNAPVISPTNTSGARGTDLFSDENGGHLFFSNSVGGAGTVRCFNFSDGSTCTNWLPAGVSGGATNATAMGPGLDAGGNMKAICFSQTFNTAPNFKCFDIGTATNVTGAAPPSWPTVFLAGHGIIAPYHIPTTAKVLFPPYNLNSAPVCYNYANSSACPGFGVPNVTPYWYSNGTATNSNVTANNVEDYGYAIDPLAGQNCMYGLGNGGVLVRFKPDGTSATTSCIPKTYTGTYSLDGLFCAKKPKQATWTNLDITNRPSQLVGGTITISDSSGVLQTITVTAANSYAVNLPATGASGTVTVTFTPDYGSNGLPTTDYQIRLEYTADINPQICYQAKVQDTDCAASEVSNHADYHDIEGDKTADVDLGKATGGKLCPSPNCLNLTETVALNPDGTATVTISGTAPPGFNATEVDVHSNTAGVSVAPPSRSFPPGPFTGTWILTGAAPGQSVDLQVTGVDPGAGTNGADKCCTSDITVVIPPPHRQPPTDLGIQKTGISEGQGPANGSGYTYTLSVTNLGAPVNGQNAVTVTDVVPAGLSFASATGTNWTCTGPFPIAAGGTLSCTYTGSGTLVTGQVLPPITVVSTNAVQGAQLPSVTNCADVAFTSASGLTDSNASNNQSCVTNGTQTGTQTDLGIQKTVATHGHGADILGYTYTLAVTNVGTPVNGQNNVTVTDVVPAGLSFASATGTNWTCTGPFPIAAGGTLTCTYTASGTLATGQALPPITVTTGSFVPDAVAPPTTNCANVAFVAGSGLTDSNASNNHSCASTGTLTAIKVVKSVQGHDNSTAVFTANVSCVPLSGSTTASGYAVGPMNNYTEVVSNVPSGAVCTISEATPLPPTDDPANCHWDTTYPDGQQATVPAGNVTVHIVNTEDCTTSTKPGSTVLIAKTVVIDGRVSRAPHESFPIRATCKEPDGTAVNLGFTASAAVDFTSPKQSVPSGTKCTVHEPMPPPSPGRKDCHWMTSYLFNGRPAAFPVTIGARASNVFMVRNELVCVPTDNPTDTSCSGSGHWNGKRCVTCEQDETWNDRTKACMEAPPLTCHDPMVLNPAGTACECPRGTKLKNGECRKSQSWLDDVLGHVHVGVGGGTGGSSGHQGGGAVQPPDGK